MSDLPIPVADPSTMFGHHPGVLMETHNSFICIMSEDLEAVE